MTTLEREALCLLKEEQTGISYCLHTPDTTKMDICLLTSWCTHATPCTQTKIKHCDVILGSKWVDIS